MEIDYRNEKVNYKIRDWETKKVPFMLVVGDKEKSSNTVSVRQHKKGDLGVQPREAFLAKMLEILSIECNRLSILKKSWLSVIEIRIDVYIGNTRLASDVCMQIRL